MTTTERLRKVGEFLRRYASDIAIDLHNCSGFMLRRCGCGSDAIGLACPSCLLLAADALERVGLEQSQQQEEGDASKFLAELEAIHKEMGFTDGCDTLTDIREGRAGAMYGDATPVTFTDDECFNMNAWQHDNSVHPFTCGNDSRHRPLIATRTGWRCADCDYRQNWAHDFMKAPHVSGSTLLRKALGINLPEPPDKEMRKAQ
jgi:hypothetical protein